MRKAMVHLLGVILIAGVCLAGPPQPVIFVGCGFPINTANCDGCQNTADDCACQGVGPVCQTNHRVCAQAYRAFQADPYGFQVWKRTTTCYKRYMCNNNSGIDGGFCEGTGQCTTSEEWVYEGAAIEYFYSTWCVPI